MLIPRFWSSLLFVALVAGGCTSPDVPNGSLDASPNDVAAGMDAADVATVLDATDAGIDVPAAPDVPPTCPPEQTRCGDTCVDPRSTVAHCGTCGNACAASQTCVAGACVCPTGQSLCGGRCVDTNAEAAHCGACGEVCPAGQLCNGGTCSASCDAPRSVCGTGSARVCVDLQSTEGHCGACGVVCPAGQSCMAGACVCPAGQSV